MSVFEVYIYIYISWDGAYSNHLNYILLLKVAAENMARKPYINWAIKRVTRSLQVLWPRSRTNIFGSSATGLSLPSSDVDLVVCLPPVRNLVRKPKKIPLMHYFLTWMI